MTYPTLIVNLQPGPANAAVLVAARQLAQQFGARVIGHCACQPMLMVTGDGYVCGDVYAADQDRMQAELKNAEADFRRVFDSTVVPAQWHDTITPDPLADHLAFAARSADLVITGRVPNDVANLSRVADIGALVLQSGRPVLIVPPALTALAFEHAVIAWKDTRESRRAALDALPLLRRMARVTVVAMAPADGIDDARASVDAVAAWLGSHGIAATPRAVESNDHGSARFAHMIEEADADVIDAGAYGHSRLREWVWGGVTRDVLFDSKRCVLVSN